MVVVERKDWLTPDTRLLEELADATLDGERKDFMEQLTTVPLLIIDDLGMRKLPRTAAEPTLTEAGRESVRPCPDPSDQVLLQAYQTISYCAMFALNPEYVPPADRDLLLGCIASSANENENVNSGAKVLMDAFSDLSSAAIGLAARFWGLEPGETSEDPELQLVAVQIEILGLSTQQVIALAFKDHGSVGELQQQKLATLKQVGDLS